MFIRTKKTPRSKSISVQLVESFRENGKTKQRVIHHIGTGKSEEEVNELKKIALVIKTDKLNQTLQQQADKIIGRYGTVLGKISEVTPKQQTEVTALEEVQRSILGIHDIYGYIYNYLGFANLFSRPSRNIAAANILRHIVLARIANPKSKRASVELLEEAFGVSINLDQVYQMMDKIDEKFCDRIQQCALAAALRLTQSKLRVLFYDATTLYYESFIEDGLKQNGYSKDKKFNQSQVILALFVTDKGLAVGYELFPGSTFEGHTLIEALENLKSRYQLSEVVFVADQGLFNENNLKLLEENKLNYIVGARIKNFSKKLQDDILDINNYKPINLKFERTRKDKEEHVQRIASFNYGDNRRIVVHYSSIRAQKDKHDRDKAIEKLIKKISKSKDPKSLLSNYGYRKYIEIKGEAKIELKQDKIAAATSWDGLLGIVTNITDSNPAQLLSYYRGLWQVEESFRINKHDLRMGSIFHWKPHRVKAHIAISFMAFVCVRYLEYRLAIQSEKLSPEEIRKALLQTQASVIQDKKSKQYFVLPSKINSHAKEIYRIMKIKMPRAAMQLKKM